jgi:hypothetical protein
MPFTSKIATSAHRGLDELGGIRAIFAAALDVVKEPQPYLLKTADVIVCPTTQGHCVHPLFPIQRVGLSEAIGDISIANRLSMPAEGVQLACTIPYPRARYLNCGRSGQTRSQSFASACRPTVDLNQHTAKRIEADITIRLLLRCRL